MKIAFYLGKNGDYIDKIICAATFSIYSHCELVMNDGLCLSASIRDGGLRSKFINLDDHWHVYELTESHDEDAIRYWFDIHRNQKYDYLGAIGSAFGLDFTFDDKKFCSYVCAIMLGINPIITPGKLFRTLKKLKQIHV